MRTFAPACVFAAALAGCTAHPAGQSPAPDLPPESSIVAAPARSPVPAFHGGGSNWRIDLQADGGVRHTARLQHAGVSTNATLVLRSATPASDPTRFTFDGTLFAKRGDTPMHIDIESADCRDGAGVVHRQSVVVAVQASAPLSGCGDVTPN
ncbi:MAG: hypothetical protein JSS44_06175 [Proteobacteria bacterium]|nr:hypothetical protein [Pseudomonadota bacterium]